MVTNVNSGRQNTGNYVTIFKSEIKASMEGIQENL